MCSSFKPTSCCSRSSLIALVTLASATLAGVIPTARIRPLSRTRSHMPLVSIHSHTPTFAPMAHLPIFDADTPIFGHPFDPILLSFLIHLHILPLHLLHN